MVLSDRSQQAAWLHNVLNKLGYNLGPIPLTGDNQGSIFMFSNTVQEIRSKYIDIYQYYVRKCIERKKIDVFFIEGTNNPVDMFMKNLGHIKFLKFRESLDLEFYST